MLGRVRRESLLTPPRDQRALARQRDWRAGRHARPAARLVGAVRVGSANCDWVLASRCGVPQRIAHGREGERLPQSVPRRLLSPLR
jgi:hypothetical protein